MVPTHPPPNHAHGHPSHAHGHAHRPAAGAGSSASSASSGGSAGSAGGGSGSGGRGGGGVVFKRRRTYACAHEGCGKTFSTSGHLARHRRVHAGSKPFACPIRDCEQRFSRHDNMTQHYRGHLRRLMEAGLISHEDARRYARASAAPQGANSRGADAGARSGSESAASGRRSRGVSAAGPMCGEEGEARYFPDGMSLDDRPPAAAFPLPPAPVYPPPADAYAAAFAPPVFLPPATYPPLAAPDLLPAGPLLHLRAASLGAPDPAGPADPALARATPGIADPLPPPPRPAAAAYPDPADPDAPPWATLSGAVALPPGAAAAARRGSLAGAVPAFPAPPGDPFALMPTITVTTSLRHAYPPGGGSLSAQVVRSDSLVGADQRSRTSTARFEFRLENAPPARGGEPAQVTLCTSGNADGAELRGGAAVWRVGGVEYLVEPSVVEGGRLESGAGGADGSYPGTPLVPPPGPYQAPGADPYGGGMAAHGRPRDGGDGGRGGGKSSYFPLP